MFGFVKLNSSALGLVLNSEDTKIYIANNASGFTCVDIMNGTQPQVISTTNRIENITVSAATSLAVQNRIFYLTDSNVGFVAFENCTSCGSTVQAPVYKLLKHI